MSESISGTKDKPLKTYQITFPCDAPGDISAEIKSVNSENNKEETPKHTLSFSTTWFARCITEDFVRVQNLNVNVSDDFFKAISSLYSQTTNLYNKNSLIHNLEKRYKKYINSSDKYKDENTSEEEKLKIWKHCLTNASRGTPGYTFKSFQDADDIESIRKLKEIIIKHKSQINDLLQYFKKTYPVNPEDVAKRILSITQSFQPETPKETADVAKNVDGAKPEPPKEKVEEVVKKPDGVKSYGKQSWIKRSIESLAKALGITTETSNDLHKPHEEKKQTRNRINHF